MIARTLKAVAILVLLPMTALAAEDWNAVGTALGKTGTEMPGGVYRIGLARTDLATAQPTPIRVIA